MSHQIAIDGPAGAGKSTIAKKISAKLGWIYVDTGAMYRAIALNCIRNGANPSEEETINSVAEASQVKLEYGETGQQVILNGENVNGLIRNEKVSKMTSSISIYPKVREKMVALQRELAVLENVVMDGRDIGTCVLPNAFLKIYLTASAEERAKRRFIEYQEKGISANLDELQKEIIERDECDMNREISPLRQAEDAVLVDSSFMTIDEVVEKIISLYNNRMGK
jgi:cytidylate kinase